MDTSRKRLKHLARMKQAESKHHANTVEIAYRQRHRLFVMEMLPTMDEVQWNEYLKWVADFSVGNDGRTLGRQLGAQRRHAATLMINIANRDKRKGMI